MALWASLSVVCARPHCAPATREPHGGCRSTGSVRAGVREERRHIMVALGRGGVRCPRGTHRLSLRRRAPAAARRAGRVSHVEQGHDGWPRAHRRAKATRAERVAPLQKIGVLRRFQTLDPADRTTVRHGMSHGGMSAEALLFLWGEPYETAGDARRYAHWSYLGSSFSMAASGHQYCDVGNRVDVSLVNGHVTGWVDYTPETWP